MIVQLVTVQSDNVDDMKKQSNGGMSGSTTHNVLSLGPTMDTAATVTVHCACATADSHRVVCNSGSAALRAHVSTAAAAVCRSALCNRLTCLFCYRYHGYRVCIAVYKCVSTRGCSQCRSKVRLLAIPAVTFELILLVPPQALQKIRFHTTITHICYHQTAGHYIGTPGATFLCCLCRYCPTPHCVN
ncbi:hypothetical protein J6590_020679 [Homalodisca vitripennis]|nr:hypothetical protein J6590_020679 [Homalodisca vitripennis]